MESKPCAFGSGMYVLSTSSLPSVYPPPENKLLEVLFAAGPALNIGVRQLVNRDKSTTYSAALRNRSCTMDPPGRLGRPGFSTDIPLDGGESKRLLKLRDGEGEPSLATSKPAFTLIPTRLVFVFVVAYMVSGWWIWIGGVIECGDPVSIASEVAPYIRRRSKRIKN